jgi:hypothetical protein
MNALLENPMDDEKSVSPNLTTLEVFSLGMSEDALIEQYGADRVRKLLLKVCTPGLGLADEQVDLHLMPALVFLYLIR